MLVDLFDVFHGCFMVSVSENLKNRNFVTFMDGFMDFVSENEKTGTFSHFCMFLWTLSVRI